MFKQKYRQEVKENKDQVAILKEQLMKGVVTLVYGAKDEEHNEALVLKEWLQPKPSKLTDKIT